ncbi:MAG: Crp/Fnr family transcriptional regulator [Sphingomonadales bacterium]|nr:Crp/Fnr family transcriptional regulator [Sphingomonadales bacterium]MBD3773935.1 Crp/Fnr family transcriptional regulator [Paracoccaceae bacterium]
MSTRPPAIGVPRGQVLFRPQEECRGFVIVHQGSIKVSLTGESGREIVLYRVRPGEVCLQTFGCLVKGIAYSAEGVAETDLEIEVVPAGEFHRRVREDEQFRSQLFGAVATRFAELEQLVEDVALSSVEQRLARALLRLADGQRIVHATHEALATEIGSAREVVSRKLGSFARAGLAASERGHIRLLDSAGLEALAGQEAVAGTVE